MYSKSVTRLNPMLDSSVCLFFLQRYVAASTWLSLPRGYLWHFGKLPSDRAVPEAKLVFDIARVRHKLGGQTHLLAHVDVRVSFAVHSLFHLGSDDGAQ